MRRITRMLMNASAPAIGAAIALAAAPAASAAIINGSFETGSFVNQGSDTMSPGVGSTVITGWTIVTDTIAWIGPSNPFSLAASNGDYFLDLTNYEPGPPFGGVSQSITTTPGATYLLTFDLGSSSRWGLPSSLNVTAGSSSQTFTSTLTAINNWEPHNLSFVASGASTLITLQGVGGLNYIGVDNVDVSLADGTGGVPEPGAWSMMILGFGAVGYILRRRTEMAQA
jgi:hypothetical protein